MDTNQRSVTSDPEPGNGPESAATTGLRWRRGLDPQDVEQLNRARADKSAIVEEIPTADASLGAFSVACLLFNRTIGSGIFNSSSVIFYNTQSIGGSLLMWLYGSVAALSGLVLYIELGLTVPRWRLRDGTKISTPRSGAELVYFNYFLKAPKYLATCLFGVSFLVFGNTATNSVAFAIAALQAAHAPASPGSIVGLAIALNTFSCLLHSMSRKWGIYLNNLLGSLKLLMLLIMIIFGFAFLDKSVSEANYSTKTSFASTPKTPTGVYRYAEALIFVIFPFCGFNQANYVLAEIRDPRRNFAWTATLGVSILCIVFIVMNTLYAAIIPKEVLFQPDKDIPLEFFMRTVGRAPSDLGRVQTACGALRALSAIGNVIVFTFTAAKVKQEVAKEGIFPYSLHLASSYEFSFRRGFRRLPAHQADHRLYAQKAPAAALLLHWTVTTVLILAAVLSTAGEPSAEDEAGHLPGYSLLAMAYTYGLDLIWFTVIGVGMLRLRLWPGSTWRHKSPVPHALGVAAAVVFTATNAFPLVAIWVPDSKQVSLARSNDRVPWFASQTMSICVMAASLVYWFGFRFYLRQRKARHGEELVVSRSPIFRQDKSAPGQQRKLVLLYEIIRLQWRDWSPETEGRETGQQRTTEVGVTDGVPARIAEVRDWRMSALKQT